MIETVTSEEEIYAETDFEAFFARSHLKLVRAMLLLTGHPAEAEDLAMEALARVFERWDTVRAMDSPEGYLFTVAVNLNRRRLRRLVKLGQVAMRGDRHEDIETKTDVRRAIARLPRGLREALVLVDWAGYSTQEAGRLLGIADGSVRSRLSRARARLRGELGDARHE